MKFGERMDVPKNIETLNEKEKIQRLYHQLGVLYSRTFLTGDWEGEHADALESGVLFDDVRSVNNAEILADDIESFLHDIRSTTTTPVHPDDLSNITERHEFNRRLFAETLKYIRDILRFAQNAGGAYARTEMMKIIDENIHYFRDHPIPRLRTADKQKDAKQASEGLKRITNALVALFETGVVQE